MKCLVDGLRYAVLLSYKLLFIAYRCHLVSLNSSTLPTALHHPLTNNKQTVQGTHLLGSCIVLAYWNSTRRGLFSARLAVYITIHLWSISLCSAIWGRGIHITGGSQIASDVSPVRDPYHSYTGFQSRIRK